MAPAAANGYLAPTAEARAELREKGSRFLAIVGPIEDESTVRSTLEKLRRQHADATHLCWAWRVGSVPREGRSDAGEPAGTAGTAMLQVLRGRGLSDVLAVVARWFGGVKLGKGGLARAYADALRQALLGLPLEERRHTLRLQVELPYDRVGSLRRLVHPPEVEILDETYGRRVITTLRVVSDHARELERALADLGAVVVRSSA